MKKIEISLPKLEAHSGPLTKASAEALVVAVASSEAGPHLVSEPLEKLIDKKSLSGLENSLKSLGVNGKPDEVVLLPGLDTKDFPVLVLTGIGSEKDNPDVSRVEALRRAAGAASRKAGAVKSLCFALPVSTAEEFTAVAEGALLGCYRFNAYKSADKKNDDQSLATIVVHSELAAKTAKELAELARARVEAVAITKDLVNTPPSHLYPETFAEAAETIAKSKKLKVTVWDEKALAKDGFGGHIGVGQGSARGPRLVKVEYRPARAKAHVAFVGKGITFDTGGISLKPPASMMTMKCDMAGAATVLGAIVGLAAAEVKVNVTAWLAMAENMPSSTATKPSDVISIFGGKTVEVMNTDAEGRLVLADAIVAASEEKPDVIIDIATLTGAQMVALGQRTSGVMGDEAIRQRVVDAAASTGELVWPMPIPEELKPSLKSEVADLSNIGERFGGMMTAAAFLREFVGEAPEGQSIPWAHIDIAGPAFNEGSPYGHTSKHATGVMVRTLMAVAEGYAR